MTTQHVGDDVEQSQLSQFFNDQQRSTYNNVIQTTLDTLQSLGQQGGDWAEYLSTSIQHAWTFATTNPVAETATAFWSSFHTWLRGIEIFYVQDDENPDFPPALEVRVLVPPTVDALVDDIPEQSAESTPQSYQSSNDGIVSPMSANSN